ncbi:putative carnitine operon oxidoreductase [Escherichia coli]|nr:putative carnitine operon oxidoreductase [Escherichia coli]SQQ81419.1 putative carnitine operon oxidoreductase [Escherichia coli]SQS57755.1 putative carnitine operon oxidoreductase [Escherichia coli]
MKTFIKTLLVAVTILFSVFATAKQVKLPNNIKYVNTTEAFSGNDSNLLIVFYVQIMPDDFVMQLHRF